jgi:hypothetical protein
MASLAFIAISGRGEDEGWLSWLSSLTQTPARTAQPPGFGFFFATSRSGGGLTH